MQPNQVVEHFGGIRATARALKIAAPSVSNWIKRGAVPALRQYQLEHLTNGKLKMEARLDKLR